MKSFIKSKLGVIFFLIVIETILLLVLGPDQTLDKKLSYTGAEAFNFFKALQPNEKIHYLVNELADLIYITLYSSLFYLWLLNTQQKNSISKYQLTFMRLFIFTPGFFDILETTSVIQIINTSYSQPLNPQSYPYLFMDISYDSLSWFTFLKWSIGFFVFAFLCYQSWRAKLQILPLQKTDLMELKIFTDQTIGTNYYSAPELEEIFTRSQKNGQMCTLVLKNSLGKIMGVRITFPPGQWKSGKGHGLSVNLWKTSLTETAYFQSLFIHPSLTGQGYGAKMSLAAINILRKLRAKAVVTHSWKESPNDSSGRYLRSLGFISVAIHPFYWKDVDYTCTRCGKPCLCTAEEMIKYL